MNSSAKRLYTIIEDDSVGQKLAEGIASDGGDKLERVFDALIWRLARQPEPAESTKITNSAGTEYRLVRALPVEGAKNPTILARYKVSKETETIEIDWIKVLPYDDAEAISLREFGI